MVSKEFNWCKVPGFCRTACAMPSNVWLGATGSTMMQSRMNASLACWNACSRKVSSEHGQCGGCAQLHGPAPRMCQYPESSLVIFIAEPRSTLCPMRPRKRAAPCRGANSRPIPRNGHAPSRRRNIFWAHPSVRLSRHNRAIVKDVYMIPNQKFSISAFSRHDIAHADAHLCGFHG